MQESSFLGILVAGVVCALGLAYLYTSSQKKNFKKVGTVSKLYMRPVKSMSTMEVQEGELTDKGFMCCGVYDKSFLMIDENARFVTARKCPKMILIKPSFSDDKKCLILSADGQNDISIPLQQNGAVDTARVQDIDKEGRDCGDEVAKWLSDFLGGTYRMVFFSRGLLAKELFKTTAFKSCGSFHLLSEKSVEDLNSRLGENVSEQNFRPNIFVKGCPPYAEDFWKYVKVGEKAEMVFAQFCSRCKMTTLNQTNGSYTSVDPLKTLREYRQCYDFVEDRKRYESKPILGTYLNIETKGRVKIGDPVFATFQFQQHVAHPM